jgi:hypothetical protein
MLAALLPVREKSPAPSTRTPLPTALSLPAGLVRQAMRGGRETCTLPCNLLWNAFSA